MQGAAVSASEACVCQPLQLPAQRFRFFVKLILVTVRPLTFKRAAGADTAKKAHQLFARALSIVFDR
jgi:hypothetical protein